MKLESKLEKFPGYVILPDFMNIRQVRQFEDAYFGDLNELTKAPEARVFVSVSDERILPFILDFVKEWHIDGLPDKPKLEDIPMTPIHVSHEFIQWIASALFTMWKGEEVPNE